MPSEADLEELLSRPTERDATAVGDLVGDLLILGVSGKMGPSLARMARRASDAAATTRRVIGVARFGDPAARSALEADGIETISCDLTDRRAVDRLPQAPNVVLMAGQKFGTADDRPRTWATNAYLPALAAEHFAGSRIVAFSTGNVYPLSPVASGGGGPMESGTTDPQGEYAQSALGRERILEFFSLRQGTLTAILRLNYANECRYGILRDVADRVWQQVPIDLTMGYVNVIWQRDANSLALRAFAHCTTPPFVLNVTGTEVVSIRMLAQRFGSRWGIEPAFTGMESDTALLSDARAAETVFGPAETSLDQMIEWVGDWVKQGGRSLGKPTHYETRDGEF